MVAKIILSAAVLGGLYLVSKSKGDNDGWSGGGGSGEEDKPEEFKKSVEDGSVGMTFNFPDVSHKKEGGMSVSEIDNWFTDTFGDVYETPQGYGVHGHPEKKAKAHEVTHISPVTGKPFKRMDKPSYSQMQEMFKIPGSQSGSMSCHRQWRKKYSQVAPRRGQTRGIIYNPKKGYRRV